MEVSPKGVGRAAQGRTVILVEEDGSPLGAFRKSWLPAVHAMYISGLKTDWILCRYDIMSDDRLKAASVKMQSLIDEKPVP